MSLFARLRQEVKNRLRHRDTTVKISRDILQASKQVIFLCHEGRLDAAAVELRQAQGQVQAVMKKLGRKYDLTGDGAWLAALEEYLEAWFLYNFLRQRKLVEPKGITAPAETYIGALADFTGEIVRLAVMGGAAKDTTALARYKKVTAEVIGFLLSLYLTGQSRQKADQAKRNLKRLEEIIYEVKIRS